VCPVGPGSLATIAHSFFCVDMALLVAVALPPVPVALPPLPPLALPLLVLVSPPNVCVPVWLPLPLLVTVFPLFALPPAPPVAVPFPPFAVLPPCVVVPVFVCEHAAPARALEVPKLIAPTTTDVNNNILLIACLLWKLVDQPHNISDLA